MISDSEKQYLYLRSEIIARQAMVVPKFGIDTDGCTPYGRLRQFIEKELTAIYETAQGYSPNEKFCNDAPMKHTDKVDGTIMKDDLRSRFTFHKPDAEGTSKMKTIRRHVRSLAHAIDILCPESREKATALTNLQTVMMHANAGIVQSYPMDEDDV